jgi:hypothetical protein
MLVAILHLLRLVPHPRVDDPLVNPEHRQDRSKRVAEGVEAPDHLPVLALVKSS